MGSCDSEQLNLIWQLDPLCILFQAESTWAHETWAGSRVTVDWDPTVSDLGHTMIAFEQPFLLPLSTFDMA